MLEIYKERAEENAGPNTIAEDEESGQDDSGRRPRPLWELRMHERERKTKLSSNEIGDSECRDSGHFLEPLMQAVLPPRTRLQTATGRTR